MPAPLPACSRDSKSGSPLMPVFKGPGLLLQPRMAEALTGLSWKAWQGLPSGLWVARSWGAGWDWLCPAPSAAEKQGGLRSKRPGRKGSSGRAQGEGDWASQPSLGTRRGSPPCSLFSCTASRSLSGTAECVSQNRGRASPSLLPETGPAVLAAGGMPHTGQGLLGASPDPPGSQP